MTSPPIARSDAISARYRPRGDGLGLRSVPGQRARALARGFEKGQREVAGPGPLRDVGDAVGRPCLEVGGPDVRGERSRPGRRRSVGPRHDPADHADGRDRGPDPTMAHRLALPVARCDPARPAHARRDPDVFGVCAGHTVGRQTDGTRTETEGRLRGLALWDASMSQSGDDDFAGRTPCIVRVDPLPCRAGGVPRRANSVTSTPNVASHPCIDRGFCLPVATVTRGTTDEHDHDRRTQRGTGRPATNRRRHQTARVLQRLAPEWRGPRRPHPGSGRLPGRLAADRRRGRDPSAPGREGDHRRSRGRRLRRRTGRRRRVRGGPGRSRRPRRSRLRGGGHARGPPTRRCRSIAFPTTRSSSTSRGCATSSTGRRRRRRPTRSSCSST